MKKLLGGKMSLYLDYYPPLIRPDTLKKTRREFLKLYTYANPKTQLQKLHNKETIAMAETMKAQRQIELQRGFYGFISKKGKSISLIQYFSEQVDAKKDKDKTWISAFNYVKRYFGSKNIRLSELSETMCIHYREFLLKADSIKTPGVKLNQNSAVAYFNRFKAALKMAYREGLIQKNFNEYVERIKEVDTHREFLTIDELKKLRGTECKNSVLKKAALFSALTGLRFGDITNLRWENIRHSSEMGYTIHFKQNKTAGIEVLPISAEAIAMLGERKDQADKIFTGLKYSATNNKWLAEWVKRAGIEKKINFHCFRHSYATNQLALGTDIYTVSKLLGHKNIQTTQIYSKVVDLKKLEAANKISLE